jgi:hypothetical protein
MRQNEVIMLKDGNLVGTAGHPLKARLACNPLAPLNLRPKWRNGLAVAARLSNSAIKPIKKSWLDVTKCLQNSSTRGIAQHRLRVLLMAEAANPESTSVPLIGWSLSRALAKLTDAHLVTPLDLPS